MFEQKHKEVRYAPFSSTTKNTNKRHILTVFLDKTDPCGYNVRALEPKCLSSNRSINTE